MAVWGYREPGPKEECFECDQLLSGIPGEHPMFEALDGLIYYVCEPCRSSGRYDLEAHLEGQMLLALGIRPEDFGEEGKRAVADAERRWPIWAARRRLSGRS